MCYAGRRGPAGALPRAAAAAMANATDAPPTTPRPPTFPYPGEGYNVQQWFAYDLSMIIIYAALAAAAMALLSRLLLAQRRGKLSENPSTVSLRRLRRSFYGLAAAQALSTLAARCAAWAAGGR